MRDLQVMLNEEAAFAQGYKAKGKKGKKEEVKEKLMNAYRQQWKELGEKRDPADIDVKATSKDQEMNECCYAT